MKFFKIVRKVTAVGENYTKGLDYISKLFFILFNAYIHNHAFLEWLKMDESVLLPYQKITDNIKIIMAIYYLAFKNTFQ